jgi:hypothetical protein
MFCVDLRTVIFLYRINLLVFITERQCLLAPYELDIQIRKIQFRP